VNFEMDKIIHKLRKFIICIIKPVLFPAKKYNT